MDGIGNDRKVCSFCGEDIASDFKRCPYCGSILETDNNYIKTDEIEIVSSFDNKDEQLKETNNSLSEDSVEFDRSIISDSSAQDFMREDKHSKQDTNDDFISNKPFDPVNNTFPQESGDEEKTMSDSALNNRSDRSNPIDNPQIPQQGSQGVSSLQQGSQSYNNTEQQRPQGTQGYNTGEQRPQGPHGYNNGQQGNQGYRMPQQNTYTKASISNGMKVFITTICNLVPGLGQLAGVIIAIVFMNSEGDPDKKSFGLALLISCLIVFVLTSISCCILAVAFQESL